MRQVGGYLKPLSVSQYLGIPLDEVQAMLESGELPGVQIGGQWRVPLAELERWLDEDVSEQELKQLARHLQHVDSRRVKTFWKEAQPKKQQQQKQTSQRGRSKTKDPSASQKTARTRKRRT
jgi:excisionase family DNA binding protein